MRKVYPQIIQLICICSYVTIRAIIRITENNKEREEEGERPYKKQKPMNNTPTSMENNNNNEGNSTVLATTPDKIKGINREEFVRLLIQALKEEGFKYHYTGNSKHNSFVSESSKLLEKESGIHLHSSPVEEFIDGILRGEWPLVLN